MTIDTTDTAFEVKMAEAAAAHIRPVADLGTCSEFPLHIWQALGNAGLLDPDAAASAGPSHCLTIARTARVLVSEGGNLGLSLSWMIHHLVAGCLVRPRLCRQACADDLWKQVKRGETTICLAVSEPDAGAHPKFLAARAERRSGGFALTGEKTYLTNGPIADAYAVVAITGEKEGKKAFSAFLLDRGTPGLTVSDPMPLPFFKPSPHGSVSMNGCEVGEDRLLGNDGEAFPDLVLPFRHLEDAVMTGPVTGAMTFIAAALALTAYLAVQICITDGLIIASGDLGFTSGMAVLNAAATYPLMLATTGFLGTGLRGLWTTLLLLEGIRFVQNAGRLAWLDRARNPGHADPGEAEGVEAADTPAGLPQLA